MIDSELFAPKAIGLVFSRWGMDDDSIAWFSPDPRARSFRSRIFMFRMICAVSLEKNVFRDQDRQFIRRSDSWLRQAEKTRGSTLR